MKHHARAALAMIVVVAGSAAIAGPATKAESIVAASKKATGGRSWDRLQAADESGFRGDAARPYRTRLNFLAYGMRSDSGSGGTMMAQGFNGETVWRRGPDGRVARMTDAKARAEAILTAYISNNGYYFPRRFPARFEYLRQADEAGRLSDVLQITPAGSRPFEIWFDRRSKQVWRVIDRGDGAPITVEASDYRPAGGVLVPYTLIVTGPDGKRLDRITVMSVAFGPVDASQFDPPRN